MLFNEDLIKTLEPHIRIRVKLPGFSEVDQWIDNMVFCVCVCQTEYSELVETLLSSQRDAVIYQRLADAFNTLTASSTPPTMDRKQKVAFLKSLEEFVANVGGLLCVK